MTQALAASLASVTTTVPDCLSEADFARVAEIVINQVGIRLPLTKRMMLETRLRKRVRALGLSSIAEYCRLLFRGDLPADELIDLIDVVTTNKTDFFREPEHFEVLKRDIVPALLAGQKSSARPLLKIWSAASSIGAEAYSTAMLLADLSAATSGFRFAILGTDICTQVLEQAVRAVYPEGMINPVPQDMRKRYLMWSRAASGRGTVRIVPELRRLCRFGRLNLMDATYPIDRDVDVIFLRNVLIYFNRQTQEAVISRIISHLRPGGYLLLGHSESMIGTNLHLRQVAPATFQRA